MALFEVGVRLSQGKRVALFQESEFLNIPRLMGDTNQGGLKPGRGLGNLYNTKWQFKRENHP
jgi:hypothetical protein